MALRNSGVAELPSKMSAFSRLRRLRVQRRGALGVAHGANDAVEFLTEFLDEMLRRITETETDQHGVTRTPPSIRR